MWLEEQLFDIWENHFADIPRLNEVIIQFGKKSKNQLGAISWYHKKSDNPIHDDKRISIIRITAHFKDTQIPVEIVRATIAHELCHYAHGFNSPLKQLYSHPHKGSIIRKEMYKRELKATYVNARKWLKLNWRNYLKINL